LSTAWGPTGQVVYERTYSRTKPDGTKEDWPETVRRVADGNLALVYGTDKNTWPAEIREEREKLVHYMEDFAILPAGRHLWATGVKGRQYLFNCHVSGWGPSFSDHFDFSFLRLMEGGGVGANYSSKHIRHYGPPRRKLKVHIVCDEDHKDIDELRPHLSDEYDPDWQGSFLVEDSREGWARAMVDLIDTFMTDVPVQHEDRVYDVSIVRPSGSKLKTFGGTASGPAPFARMMLETARILNDARERSIITPLHAMEIDHAIAECVVSGGNRRSARMAIVHWDDPFIFEFLKCKQDTGKHWTTNISVEVDDQFFEGLDNDDSPLNWKTHKVHEAVVRGMLENGEPGYWNSTLSQVGEVGSVISTNPCGEIALEAWENCNLGHVNLDYFAPAYKGGPVDAGIYEAHQLVARFLIRATYGDVNDPKQADMLVKNRRIGVGHLGVQGFFAKRGISYTDVTGPKHRRHAESLLRTLRRMTREAARKYAFELRIPEPIKVTTVAPTGSVAKLPGVSEGIHPIYARWFERRVRFSKRDPEQRAQIIRYEEQGFRTETDIYDKSFQTEVVVFPTEDILVAQVRAMGIDESVVESADEISVETMLNFQQLYQECWADNAVSYTINVPEGKVTPEKLAGLLQTYLPTLKGTTVMVDASRPQAPYTRITKADYEAAFAKTVEDSTDLECSSGACPIR
jgi:adenosylcobalamin-dependent ribonucleoside-triphosphate reductase